MAIPDRSDVPNGRPRQLSDRSRCPVRWQERKYSTAACGSATERQESFWNFPVRTPDRLLRCFRREREFFASSFRRLSNGRRLAPGSTRRHVQGQRRKLCSGPAGPRGSARSAANHPARYAPKSCRRPWTCTFHFRKKSRSACRLLPSRRKLRSNPTAQPRSLQSMQSAANRRPDSTFAPRRQSSKFRRPRFRNSKLPAARARPPLQACAPREMARSSSTAAPERV